MNLKIKNTFLLEFSSLLFIGILYFLLELLQGFILFDYNENQTFSAIEQENFYREIAEEKPDDPDALYSLIHSLLVSSKNHELLAVSDKFIEKFPDYNRIPRKTSPICGRCESMPQ